MYALAYLLRRADTALRYRDLISIAAYSTTPVVAFNAAIKLGWYKGKAESCQFLAMVLHDYGPKVFRSKVRRRCGNLCLCKCHLRWWHVDDF